MKPMRKILRRLTLSFLTIPALLAQLKLPAIIGDHMVIQQKQSNPIWGWDTAGTRVTVAFAGQVYSAIAGSDGKWSVKLNPVLADSNPQTLTVEGSSRKEIQDVL